MRLISLRGLYGLLLLFVLPRSNCSSFVASDPEPGEYAIHSIDVSKDQGDVDWPFVRRSGIRFVYLKATEGGDHADEAFVRNWLDARLAVLATVACHFCYFCRPMRDQIA